ncbi:MAG: ribonuclease H-like domain-containing protein [Roseburia sp.]
MKTIHKELLFQKKDKMTLELFTADSIFFDIETTGFSPAHSSLYLIGCARRSGDYLCVDQFFAENSQEEKLILNAFLELLKQYQTIITFNGIGFDIPYLKAKCDQHGLTEHFSDFSYVDIFKSVTQIKHILNLTNYKQKTVETFLGIVRDDQYSGGDLIAVYENYKKNQAEDLLSLLLLHNYEDVLGMIDLLPILSYVHLFNGQYSNIVPTVNELTSYHNTRETEIILEMETEFFIPQKFSYSHNGIYLCAHEYTCRISVRLWTGELKYFFPNYRDYYYLPAEDQAIHKSVSSYVDKSHRVPAKAATCYTRHEGVFVPEYEELITPAFKREYKDKISYFELTTNFLQSQELLSAYTNHLLKYLKSQKPSR